MQEGDDRKSGMRGSQMADAKAAGEEGRNEDGGAIGSQRSSRTREELGVGENEMRKEES